MVRAVKSKNFNDQKKKEKNRPTYHTYLLAYNNYHSRYFLGHKIHFMTERPKL